MARRVITFYSPVDTNETIEIIKNTVLALNGKIKIEGNLIKAKWKSPRYKTLFAKSFTFYVGKEVVRVVMNDGKDGNLRIKWERKCKEVFLVWDEFIKELTESYHDLNFELETGNYHIVSVKLMSDGIEQVSTSTSVSRPSIGGALIGGALFGGVGAIVGGSGGKTRTQGSTRTDISGVILLAVRYSNGLNLEGSILKTNSVYDKIMAGFCEVIE